ncbi:hypothetical protein A9K97_gp080 [Tokyovirus A1]|uniref:hypothetical protein n=1 Tax=Tokyovirus A1 TaxID=1826170 RepID=UPI0007A9679C|nr:hypothetical protein A9K97_gp080 [Tokyovirus A1]BAU80271.1 hypothetical protein [Tokyovirus A1]
MPFCVSCGSWVQNPKVSNGQVFCGKDCTTKGNFCRHTGLPKRSYLVRQRSLD